MNKRLCLFIQFPWLFTLLFSCGFRYIDVPPEPTRVAHRSNPQDGADDQDKKIYRNNPEFTTRLKFCGREMWGDSTKTAECLREHFSELTSITAGCFGEFIGCSTRNCKWPCLTRASENTEECRHCARSHCGDEWANCTGSPLSDLPQ